MMDAKVCYTNIHSLSSFVWSDVEHSLSPMWTLDLLVVIPTTRTTMPSGFLERRERSTWVLPTCQVAIAWYRTENHQYAIYQSSSTSTTKARAMLQSAIAIESRQNATLIVNVTSYSSFTTASFDSHAAYGRDTPDLG